MTGYIVISMGELHSRSLQPRLMQISLREPCVKVVLCHGVFDLLHIGHLVHLEEARMFGDIMKVSVVADKFVLKPRPLIYKEGARLRLLSALRCVDEVLLCNAPGPEKIIAEIHPDVYVRGPDYIGRCMPESEILEELGIPIRFTASSYKRTTEIAEEILRLFCDKSGNKSD